MSNLTVIGYDGNHDFVVHVVVSQGIDPENLRKLVFTKLCELAQKSKADPPCNIDISFVIEGIVDVLDITGSAIGELA